MESTSGSSAWFWTSSICSFSSLPWPRRWRWRDWIHWIHRVLELWSDPRAEDILDIFRLSSLLSSYESLMPGGRISVFSFFFPHPGRWPGVGQVSRARLEGGTCLALANVRGRQVSVCRLLMIIIYIYICLMIFISLQLIPVKSIQNNVNSIHTYVFFHLKVGHQRLSGQKRPGCGRMGASLCSLLFEARPAEFGTVWCHGFGLGDEKYGKLGWWCSQGAFFFKLLNYYCYGYGSSSCDYMINFVWL